MDLSLPPFGTTEACPRCGHKPTHAGARFGVKYHEDKTGDHIIRTCPRCAKTWPEAVPEGK